MRRNSLLLLALLIGVDAQALNPPKPPDDPANPPSKPAPSAPAPTPSPAPPTPPPTPPPVSAPTATAKKAVPTKPVQKADPGDEEEQPSKNAPRRFIPTEKGKADEDIPYPVDI